MDVPAHVKMRKGTWYKKAEQHLLHMPLVGSTNDCLDRSEDNELSFLPNRGEFQLLL